MTPENLFLATEAIASMKQELEQTERRVRRYWWAVVLSFGTCLILANAEKYVIAISAALFSVSYLLDFIKANSNRACLNTALILLSARHAENLTGNG